MYERRTPLMEHGGSEVDVIPAGIVDLVDNLRVHSIEGALAPGAARNGLRGTGPLRSVRNGRMRLSCGEEVARMRTASNLTIVPVVLS
jgi:hypothetical protein